MDEFTNTFRCRRTVPVSSQTLRYKAAWVRWRSSSAARTVNAEIESRAAPAQYVRSGPGTWIVTVGVGPICEMKVITGGWDDATAPTSHAILDRHGLVTRTRRSRPRTEGTPLSEGASANSLWCADYKEEFRLGNQRYCYPLTVTDHASRYLLLCEAMESNAEKTAFTAFERLFKERGLPQAIRSDNGVPFASPNGLFNLSALGLVVAAQHQHRTHPAWSSATERPSRTHSSDLEERSHAPICFSSKPSSTPS